MQNQHLTIETLHGVVVVHILDRCLSGRAQSPQLWNSISELISQQTGIRLVLDLSQVTFLPSVGISELIQLIRTCRSTRGQLALCCLCPSILEALQLLRLDRQIPLFETIPDAIVGVGGTI